MVDFKHRRDMRLELGHVLCHVVIHETAAKPGTGAHRDFIRSALRDWSDYPPPDRALGSTSEQQHPPVLAVKATKSTNILQVFVKTFEGKSITISNVTGRTSVEDLKLKLKEKTRMRGVWPELRYRGAWLHDRKPLSNYGIDHAATLEMTWRLLGGGLTPAPAPNTGAASSHAAANTVVPLDENNAAKPGPRARSVSPSVAPADANEEGNNVHVAHKPTIAFMDERAAHRQDATDSRTMAESEGHALLRMTHITEACNLESLEDEDGRTADMVPHNMEALNVARQTPAFEIAAANGATALDASIAAESAGVKSAHPLLISSTHAHRRQVGHLRFGFRRKRSGHGIRHTVTLWSRALLSTIDHLALREVISSLVGRGHVI
jgi:hypothetical protein